MLSRLFILVYERIYTKYMKKTFLTNTRIIALGFFITILIGTILLSLPVSVSAGEDADIITSLFTSTTSVCVTGLVLTDTFSYWSLFGKIVILILIQIGGLGIVSITTLFMLLFRRKISLKDSLLIQDSFNLNDKRGLFRFVIKVFKGTMLIEAIGAVIYGIYFCREVGFIKGIGFAIFHSVSAFCNAGLDIIGSNSLIDYNDNPLILLNTAFLIIMGGIGFIVWWDVSDAVKKAAKKEKSIKSVLNGVSLQTKLAISTTLVLLIGGAVVIFILERNNDLTIGGFSTAKKILNSIFQSVTLRTAGFASISQGNLKPVTAIFCMILMFIGGSPVGTAGGIKTVTFSVLFFTVVSMIKNDDDVSVFKRTIPVGVVKKAATVFMISLGTVTVMTILLLATNDLDAVDGIYEVVSAVCTVGLSRGITASLNTVGKIIIIICMFMGRVGPISMVIAFNSQNEKNKLYKYPEENVIVG